MNRFTRWLVIALSVTGLAATAALFVREAVLAAGGEVVWGRPAWYESLVGDGSWRAAGIAGIAATGVSVVLLVTVLWMAVPKRASARHLQLGEGETLLSVPIGALERMLARVWAGELGGDGRVEHVWVARRQGRLATHTCISVVPSDLPALQARLLARARDALGGATGLEVDDLVLEVDRFLSQEKGLP